MTCSVITFRGWVCGVHAPERWRAYLGEVSTLAAFARLHRLLTPHTFPCEECPTCDGIDRRRRELAETCPA